VGISQLGIATLPRLLAVEVLLAEPEALQDDVLESCLYILRDRLRGTEGESWSEIVELSARVAKLEAWVEVVMRTLVGMQVEPVLIELDEARRAYDEEDE
jgi:hypothetical protein